MDIGGIDGEPFARALADVVGLVAASARREHRVEEEMPEARAGAVFAEARPGIAEEDGIAPEPRRNTLVGDLGVCRSQRLAEPEMRAEVERARQAYRHGVVDREEVRDDRRRTGRHQRLRDAAADPATDVAARAE